MSNTCNINKTESMHNTNYPDLKSRMDNNPPRSKRILESILLGTVMDADSLSIGDIINAEILSYYVNFYKEQCTFEDDTVKAETVEVIIMTIITRKLREMIAEEYKKATEAQESIKSDTFEDKDNVFLIDCNHMSDESCGRCSSYPYK